MEIVTDLNFLKQESLPVEQHEIKDLSEKLLTAFKEQGDGQAVGLAMIQIGVPKDIFCVKLPWWEEPKVYINLDFKHYGTPVIFEEQCLSLPGVTLKCIRSSEIKVNYTDINGNSHEEIYGCSIPDLAQDGMCKMIEAIVIQHESSHCRGKTIYDYNIDKKNDWSNSDDIIV